MRNQLCWVFIAKLGQAKLAALANVLRGLQPASRVQLGKFLQGAQTVFAVALQSITTGLHGCAKAYRRKSVMQHLAAGVMHVYLTHSANR